MLCGNDAPNQHCRVGIFCIICLTLGRFFVGWSVWVGVTQWLFVFVWSISQLKHVGYNVLFQLENWKVMCPAVIPLHLVFLLALFLQNRRGVVGKPWRCSVAVVNTCPHSVSNPLSRVPVQGVCVAGPGAARGHPHAPAPVPLGAGQRCCLPAAPLLRG